MLRLGHSQVGCTHKAKVSFRDGLDTRLNKCDMFAFNCVVLVAVVALFALFCDILYVSYGVSVLLVSVCLVVVRVV